MTIEAYNVKKKVKEEMHKAVIDITSNGRYFAKGVSSDGDKLCVAMGKAKAEEAVSTGVATKGEGW
jgi:hypothetical protein